MRQTHTLKLAVRFHKAEVFIYKKKKNIQGVWYKGRV